VGRVREEAVGRVREEAEDAASSPATDPRRIALVAGATGFAVVVVALLTLAGWVLDIGWLRNPFPGGEMKANTALALAAIGAAAMLAGIAGGRTWARRAVVGLAASSGLVALLNLAEWATDADLGIDLYVGTDGVNTAGTAVPGRMEVSTAFPLVMLAAALTLVLFRRRSGERATRRVAETLGLSGLWVGVMELVGHAYGARGVLAPGGTLMAPTTAACLVLISVGVVIIAGGPLLHFVTGRLPGSAMARRLLPVSVSTIMIIGGLRLAGQRAGLFSDAVGGTLFVMLTIVAICGPILLFASRVNGTELARRAASRGLAAEEERIDALRYSDLTHKMSQVVHTSLDIDEVVTRAVNRMGPAFGVDRAYVRLVRTDGDAPIAREWCAPGVSSIVPTVGEKPLASLQPMLTTLIEESLSVVIDDATDDKGITPEQRDDLASLGARAMVACPVGPNRGEVLGMVALEQGSARAWTTLEITAVEQIGRDIGVAVSHGRAFELQTALVEQAKEVDALRSDFVSKVSHELRSPLTSVLGYLELLDSEALGTLNHEQRRMLKVIDRNGRRLLALVEDLLTLSRIEGGTFRIRFARVELMPIIANVMQSFAPLIAKQCLTSTVTVEPDIVLDADSEQLERVVTNLVSNAVKFTPPGGRVDVAARREHERAVISVIDTGVGIPEDEQPNLFHRFFRSTLSQELHAEGTGLGLFIVKQVVEGHGGTVEAASVPDEGTTVTLRVPLTCPSDESRSTGKEEVGA